MRISFIKELVVSLFLIFCQTVAGQSQKAIDSLSKKPFDTLERYFEKHHIDSVHDNVYLKAYLKKALHTKDPIKTATAYYYLSGISPLKKALYYCDSIIDLTNDIKNHTTYPYLGYMQKGNIYYKAGNYKKALDYYLTCHELSTKSKNQFYILNAKENIGLLGNKIGERQEALTTFRSYVRYLENSDIADKEYYLTKGRYLLAESYVWNKKNDSAAWVINKGLDKALKANDTLQYARYVYLSGVNLYDSKDYRIAMDSLSKSKQMCRDENLHTAADLYLGKCYHALGQENSAFHHFKKVDSFLQKTKNLRPEFIEIYPALIAYQKRQNNLEGQLYYINRLLKFDSILTENNTYLSENIVKKYEVPHLIASKNQIIDALTAANKISGEYIYTLLALSILLLLITLFYIRRNISNKRKFKAILEAQKLEIQRLNSPDNLRKIIAATDLPEDMVEALLLQLEAFERKNKFVKNYTLSSLAKELKTNSSYLSKVINATKGCNFSSYLNELRIDFVLRKLTTDKAFRTYTIKAIASEAGFNTPQSFSKAFYKKTGLYPSCFIKQIAPSKVE